MMEDVRKNLIDAPSEEVTNAVSDTLANDLDTKDAISKVDHTLLKAFASLEDIYKLCDEAILYKTASVCIPPSYIKPVKEKYGDNLKICTVIGFPLGYETSAVKAYETKDAVENGADEIDVVINIGMVKNKDYDSLLNELIMVREACKDKILKVIIETCYLTEEEKVELCKIVTKAGADYIKTSTGFGTAGAKLEDIELFKKNIGPNVKIKAAGGISTKEDFLAFIAAGCDRVGASRTKDFL
jgi:deoxyribose-phosphate aldolase